MLALWEYPTRNSLCTVSEIWTYQTVQKSVDTLQIDLSGRIYCSILPHSQINAWRKNTNSLWGRSRPMSYKHFHTFNHLTYLFFIQIMSLGISKCSQKVLETIVDFSVWCKKCNPFTNWMSFCILQIVNAFNLLKTSKFLHNMEDNTNNLHWTKTYTARLAAEYDWSCCIHLC